MQNETLTRAVSLHPGTEDVVDSNSIITAEKFEARIYPAALVAYADCLVRASHQPQKFFELYFLLEKHEGPGCGRCFSPSPLMSTAKQITALSYLIQTSIIHHGDQASLLRDMFWHVHECQYKHTLCMIDKNASEAVERVA